LGRLDLSFIEADGSWKDRVAVFSQWGESAARHLHVGDGFTLLALHGDELVGMISVCWKELPPPLSEDREAYIDILEVRQDCRRQGVAARLIDLSAEYARAQGAIQLRAWSSLDKEDAIRMWKALGFGLCPAVTFPGGQEVRGYFATLPLKQEAA
jgi:GNAT superfamily N-acetyltransferase